MEGIVMAKKKKVYVCQICNTYFPKDADEAVPVCCGKEMVVMDEFEEDEVKNMKESSGGL
jgi:rubrerythrin